MVANAMYICKHVCKPNVTEKKNPKDQMKMFILSMYLGYHYDDDKDLKTNLAEKITDN